MNDMFHSSSGRVLRPYQEKAIRMVRDSFKSGSRKTVLQLPTGGGKTRCAAEIILGARAKGNSVIFTAPAVSLIDQTVQSFEAEGIDEIGVMQANHPRTDPLAKVQVASVQTLAKREIPAAAIVIVDECHLKAEVIDRMMSDRPDVFFLGLSATPWAKGMGLRWDDLRVAATIGDLIEGGYLSKFKAFAPDIPDLSGVKTVAGDYAEGQLAEVMEDGQIMASIVETWLGKGEDRPTLCFCVNRAHAAQVKAQFERVGVSSAYVDAFTDRVERQHINRLFKRGDVKVIVSVRTMTTGVDLPVSCIIDAAPTKSEILHIQKLGRGLRINPGTEDCLYLDHAGNLLRLGLPTDIHHETLDKTRKGERQKAEKGAKLPKECANCGALVSGLICPYCGHERKPVAGVETVDGDLIEITGSKREPTKADKQAWWSGIKEIQRLRQRSDGWASHTYRDKFGVWPRGLSNLRANPTQEMWNFVKSKDIRFAKSRQRS